MSSSAQAQHLLAVPFLEEHGWAGPAAAYVADAVVPTPTPIELGADIFTLTVDPVYPDPPLPIVNALIVPAAETVAVIAAATGSSDVLTIKASILIGLPTS